MDSAQANGSTTDPLLGAIYFSEYVNKRNSGILVAPWEVDDMPEEYKAAYLALQRADARKQSKRQHDAIFESARARSGYRHYLRRRR